MAVHDPEKLPPAWEPLLKRLAGVADRECGRRGYAIVTIQVLVDHNAEPVFWGEPELTKLEPRQGATKFLQQVLQMLGKERIVTE